MEKDPEHFYSLDEDAFEEVPAFNIKAGDKIATGGLDDKYGAVVVTESSRVYYGGDFLKKEPREHQKIVYLLPDGASLTSLPNIYVSVEWVNGKHQIEVTNFFPEERMVLRKRG